MSNVSDILLYALPGFLAVQLYRTFYPAKRQSQFEIIVHSVLHSVIIYVGLHYASCLPRWKEIGLPSLQSKSLSIAEPSTILILLSGGLFWGCLLITYYRWIRVHLPFLPQPDPLAIWPLVATDAPKANLWVLACTKQGLRYFGWLERHSFDPTVKDHDFLLRPAYLVDNNLHVQRDLKVGGVYLNTRDIESLEINHAGEWGKVFQKAHQPGSAG